jgi:hypothetical protein
MGWCAVSGGLSHACRDTELVAVIPSQSDFPRALATVCNVVECRCAQAASFSVSVRMLVEQAKNPTGRCSPSAVPWPSIRMQRRQN